MATLHPSQSPWERINPPPFDLNTGNVHQVFRTIRERFRNVLGSINGGNGERRGSEIPKKPRLIKEKYLKTSEDLFSEWKIWDSLRDCLWKIHIIHDDSTLTLQEKELLTRALSERILTILFDLSNHITKDDFEMGFDFVMKNLEKMKKYWEKEFQTIEFKLKANWKVLDINNIKYQYIN
jgi:hypothetical protein